MSNLLTNYIDNIKSFIPLSTPGITLSFWFTFTFAWISDNRHLGCTLRPVRYRAVQQNYDSLNRAHNFTTKINNSYRQYPWLSSDCAVQCLCLQILVFMMRKDNSVNMCPKNKIKNTLKSIMKCVLHDVFQGIFLFNF